MLLNNSIYAFVIDNKDYVWGFDLGYSQIKSYNSTRISFSCKMFYTWTHS